MKTENFFTTGPLFGTVERYFCRVDIKSDEILKDKDE